MARRFTPTSSLTARSALTALWIAAATATAPAVAAPPDGKIAIHYSRCDGNYDGWGLHAWSGSTPIPGVSWGAPLAPAGKNEFGVFWQADLKDFGSAAKVNYIIHKGDTKEQGGKDMSFDGNTVKEIWVNSGDRKIYTSADEAAKGRAETPCQ